MKTRINVKKPPTFNTAVRTLAQRIKTSRPINDGLRIQIGERLVSVPVTSLKKVQMVGNFERVSLYGMPYGQTLRIVDAVLVDDDLPFSEEDIRAATLYENPRRIQVKLPHGISGYRMKIWPDGTVAFGCRENHIDEWCKNGNILIRELARDRLISHDMSYNDAITVMSNAVKAWRTIIKPLVQQRIKDLQDVTRDQRELEKFQKRALAVLHPKKAVGKKKKV